MILAMLLAHLIGDYVLQTDRLAAWKGRSLAGVAAHCGVVTLVTFALVLPFDPTWWEGAAVISLAHFLIDAVQLPLTRRRTRRGEVALLRFGLDQVAHLLVIFTALQWGGYLPAGLVWSDVLVEVRARPWLALVTGYTLLAMPAWVALEFLTYGLVNGSPPDFGRATNKYTSSLERMLIATFVLLGQYLLVPLVALPRLVAERNSLADGRQANLYLTKLLASVGLAIAIGLMLQLVWGPFSGG